MKSVRFIVLTLMLCFVAACAAAPTPAPTAAPPSAASSLPTIARTPPMPPTPAPQTPARPTVGTSVPDIARKFTPNAPKPGPVPHINAFLPEKNGSPWVVFGQKMMIQGTNFVGRVSDIGIAITQLNVSVSFGRLDFITEVTPTSATPTWLEALAPTLPGVTRGDYLVWVGTVPGGWSNPVLVHMEQPLPRQKEANATSRGCRTGGIHDMNRLQPEWVTVRDDADFVRAEGYVRQYQKDIARPRMGESDSGGAGLSFEDWEVLPWDMAWGLAPPPTHSKQQHEKGITGHDWTWNVLLDREYDYLLEEGMSTQAGLHSEWESMHLPDYAKPAAGDRVVMWGRWVWDCGHSPYKTEIHPPRALVTIREEGALMPGPGYPQQDSFLPVRAKVARVYISSVGSDRIAIPPVGVGNRTFEFDIALPPRPSPDAQPVWRFPRDSCHGVSCSPPSAPTTMGVNVQVTPVPVGDPHFLHVKISNPPDPTFLVVAASWTGMRLNEVSRITVKFDQIMIMDDLDPNFSGEWLLVVGANGQYCTIGGGDNSLSDVDDDDIKNLRRSPDGKNPCQPQLYLAAGQTLRIVAMGYECDLDIDCESVNPPPLSEEWIKDEDIGDFYREYFPPKFGLGEHPIDKTAIAGDGCAGYSRTGSGSRIRTSVGGTCNYKISYTITGNIAPITEIPSGGPE